MKLNKIFFTLGLIGLLSSCSAGKKTVKNEQEGNDRIEVTSNTYNKVRFDHIFFEAVKEKMLGNYARAAEYFQGALEVNDQSSAAWYELGRSYMKLTQLDKAEAATLKATQLDKTNPYYLEQLAEVYRFRRKYDESAKVYEQLIELKPDEQGYYAELAGMYEYLKKPEDALKVYDRFEKRFGQNPQITRQKLQIYAQSGKMDKAEAEVKKLLKDDPDNELYNHILAEIYIAGGEEDKAFEVYNRLLEKNPDDGAVQMAMADFYMKKGDDAEAMKMLEKAFANPSVDIDRKTAILYNNYLMQKSVSEADKGNAARLARLLVQAHPKEAKAYAVLGDVLYQNKEMEASRDAFRQSLEMQKDIFAVWQQLLLIESELRDFKAMELESEKGLEYFPNQPVLYYFNGLAKMEQQDYNSAISMFESGLNLSAEQPSLETQFYLNLAEAHFRKKEYAASDSYFEKILKNDPSNATALNNYAYYLSTRKEKLDKAEEMSKKSLLKEPDNASFLDTYGWILYQQGKYEGAEKYIGKALEQDRQSAEVNEHYGDVQFKLGNNDKAVEYWKKAKALGGGSQQLDRKIANKQLYD